MGGGRPVGLLGGSVGVGHRPHEGEVGIHVVGHFHGQTQVLGGVRQRKGRVVGAGHDLRAVGVGHVAPAGAVADQVQHLRRVNAALDAQHEGLDQAHRLGVAEADLGDLGHVPRSVRAEVVDLAADGLEQGHAAGHRFVVTAHEHRDGAGLGALGPTGHRGVHQVHARRLGRWPQSGGTIQVAGRQVDPDGVGPHGGEQLGTDGGHLFRAG